LKKNMLNARIVKDIYKEKHHKWGCNITGGRWKCH
jgi:hypothetical protein